MSESQADKLLSKGYRVVSRKYCIVSRIDCSPEEYLEAMDAYIGGDHMHVYEFIAPNWYDHYRRILSDDKLTVCQSVMEWMTRKSCWDRCSFRQAFAKYFRERSSNG